MSQFPSQILLKLCKNILAEPQNSIYFIATWIHKSDHKSDRMLTMIKSSDEQSYFNIDQQNDDRNWDVSAKGPVYKKKTVQR